MSSLFIAQQIADGLGGGFRIGSNIFIGTEKPPKGDQIPEIAVFITATGGFASRAMKDKTQLSPVSYQVTVRHQADQWILGEALANQVLDLVDFKPPSNFIELSSRSTRASPFPPTQTGSLRWIFNLDGLIHEGI